MCFIKYQWQRFIIIVSLSVTAAVINTFFTEMLHVVKAQNYKLGGQVFVNTPFALDGFQVKAVAQSGTTYWVTPGAGWYIFHNGSLPDGMYTIHHNSPCPSNTPMTINIPAPNNRGPDIHLNCETYAMGGYIKIDGEYATRSLMMTIKSMNGSIEQRVYSYDNGFYLITNLLIAGSYTLDVQVAGCQSNGPITINIPESHPRGPDIDISCTPAPTPTNTPAPSYDLGFRPNLNGYQFDNQALFPTGSTLWDMFEQFFGRDNVRKSDGTKCQAAVNYSNEKYKNVAGGFSCVGYSVTSLISYLKTAQPNAGSFAMPYFDQLFNQPKSVDLTNPIAYYSRTQLSRAWANDWQTQIETCRTNSNGPVERIKQGLQNRQPLIVNLNSKWNSYWHALLPYRMEEVSSTEAYIYVYDSERKGEERQIHFQRSGSDWRWTYTFVGSMAPAGTPTNTNCEDIYLYPLETALRRGEPLVNFCERSTGISTVGASDTVARTGRILANLSSEGDWIVRDSSERRLGWLNGQLVSEIPNAYAIPYSLGTESLTFRSLYLPEAQYFVEVNNSSNLAVDYTIFGDGRMLKITKQLRSASSVSRIQLNSSLEQMTHYDMQNLAALTLHFDYELSTASRLATMDGINISSSEDLDTQFDGERLKISRAGGSLQYNVKFEQMGGQYLIFVSDSISLGANEAHILSPTNWGNLSNVVLEIDRGRDGTVEEKHTLENRAVHIYLPVIQQSAIP